MTTTTNTPTTSPAAEDREALIASLMAGLDELKRRPMSVRYSPRGGPKPVRVQFELTAPEHAMLKTVRNVGALAVGRPITGALAMRVGLAYLMKACTAALADPVAKEKLRADILGAREARVAEINIANSFSSSKGSDR